MFDSRYIAWASITISDQCPRSATFLNSCHMHNFKLTKSIKGENEK